MVPLAASVVLDPQSPQELRHQALAPSPGRPDRPPLGMGARRRRSPGPLPAVTPKRSSNSLSPSPPRPAPSARDSCWRRPREQLARATTTMSTQPRATAFRWRALHIARRGGEAISPRQEDARAHGLLLTSLNSRVLGRYHKIPAPHHYWRKATLPSGRRMVTDAFHVPRAPGDGLAALGLMLVLGVALLGRPAAEERRSQQPAGTLPATQPRRPSSFPPASR